jgi:hypothetical protein
MNRILATLMAFAMAAGVSVVSAADAPTVSPGSIVRVRLDTTITSKTNKVGDTFEGTVAQDVLSGSEVVVPAGSKVNGHIAFVKPAGRIKAKAQMRVVLDSIVTPEEQTIALSSTLEDSKGGVCGQAASDEEGTIEGCGKSKKDAAKDSAMGAAIGAGAGAAVGTGQAIECRYYGNCGGPSMGADILYGAGIGAGTALIYNIFKHQKDILLIRGSELTFVVNRTLESPSNGSVHEAAASQEAVPGNRLI